jgi:hypothetical protein
VDLSRVQGRDVAIHVADRPIPYLTIRLPMPQQPAAIELVRCGIDLYSVPILLRLWANKLEQDLTQGGGVPEEVVEQEDNPALHGGDNGKSRVPVAAVE